ncbi:MAG TPA: trigger factor, partial [Chromatiales bacterium]|nr:trigger factor [Chromatiales bacterium]
MQVSVEAGEGLERRMTVELPAEQVDQEVEKRLRKIARTARMDGFRPGKVPMSIVRRRYGGEVRQEVFGELVQSTFYDAASKEELKPAGLPRIEPAKEEEGEGAFRYTAVFEVMPDITLASLDEVVIKRPVAEVTEADVDEMMERLRKQRTTWKDVERPAQEGDQLTISFKGTIEGEPFEGGEAEDYALVLGAGTMIEGFE